MMSAEILMMISKLFKLHYVNCAGLGNCSTSMMAKTYLTKLVRLLPHREMIMIQNRIRMQSYNFSVMHFQLDCLIPKMTPFPTYNNIWILPCSFQSLSNLFSFLIFHGNLLNVVTIWPHLSLQSFSFALLLTLLTHNKTQDGC